MPGTPFLRIGDCGAAGGLIHIAFAAKDHAALGTWAKDNGGPGLRQHYHADYYAEFVIDPEGKRIEAVYHRTAT